MNCFQLLGMPVSFALDEALLDKKYFDLQKRIHPDRFAGKPEAERVQALQCSMDANKAYHVLKSPLLRAQALLALQGIKVNTEHDTVKPSPELLMEIMELREESTPSGKISRLYDDCLHRLAASFDKKDYQAAAQETLRLNYLDKIRNDAELM